MRRKRFPGEVPDGRYISWLRIVHELSIVESLIEQVAQEVEAAGSGGRVTQLDLAIGRLSGIHVDSLRFAFEVLAQGTLVEAAELAIRQPSAQAHCHDCGSQFDTGEFIPACIQCASGNVRIEGGQEIMLESIELEENG